MSCPNINSAEWKMLVGKIGVFEAMREFVKFGHIPNAANYDETFQGVNATLKIIQAMQRSPRTSYPSAQINGFYNDLIKFGAPSIQIELLKDHIARNNIKEINTNELITSLLAESGYTIEINIARSKNSDRYTGYGDLTDLDTPELKEEANTQHYSSLTVPGGTNYTENELRTPAITPSIKGHAAFATDKGIGWFRSDDKAVNSTAKEEEIDAYLKRNPQSDRSVAIHNVENDGMHLLSTKTRRILEVQSDLFQKGRGKENLTTIEKVDDYDYTTAESFEEAKELETSGWDKHSITEDGIPKYSKLKDQFELRKEKDKAASPNQFLQLLNKDNNWVGLFVKSIIQDSARKGYENVLFPSGDTAAKVEGHQTIEQFIKDREEKISHAEGEIIQLQKPVQLEIVGKEATDRIIEGYQREMEQFKKELADAKAGTLKISAVANFYENNIANILKKAGYSPRVITDEYGNKWNQVELKSEHKNTIFFQKDEGMKQAKASPKTIVKVKEWMNRAGIKLSELDTSRYGGVNGVAIMLDRIIQIAEGKEDVAITEESMHMLTGMIKQGNKGLYNRMLNKISTYDVYKQTFDVYKSDALYQDLDGSPDVLKIKEEAIGKLLAEYYLKQEQPEDAIKIGQQKAWWQAIMDWIKELLNINTNPFKEAISQMDDVKDSVGGRALAIKNLAERISDQVPDSSYFKDAIFDMVSNGQYNLVISEIGSQLTDFNSYDTMARILGNDERLISDITEMYGVFLQTGEEWDLKKKFKDKIKQYDLQKKTDTSDPDDENNSSYYTVKIDGRETKTDRTTDYAKRANKRTSKGKDYLEDKASPEEKKLWQKMALQGTTGHYNMEQILRAAANKDGTIKDIKDIVIPPAVGVNATIYAKMVEFLIGTQAKPGFLYQFEPGAKIITEQMIYNDTVSSKVDGKALQGRAGTIDLLVELPDGKGVKLYDWKFMKDLLEKPDQNFLKRQQHAYQLGDYKRTLKDAYGITASIEAFTIPIHAEYGVYKNPTTKEETPVLRSVTFGKLNFRDEDRTPMLPVVPDDQSSGNKKVDVLVKQLKAKYNKLYKLKVGDEEYNNKIEELNNLSAAIRNVQVALNFSPLALEAKNFRDTLTAISEKYEKTPIEGLTLEQKKSAISELLSVLNAADYYSELDKVFISEYGDDGLSPEEMKTLAQLRLTSSSIGTKKDTLLDLLKDIVGDIAQKEGFTDFISAEKEAVGIINSMTEAASVPNKSIKLLAKLILVARSRDAISTNKEIERFEKLYLAVSKTNSNVFSVIANKDSHELIKKVNPDFYKEIDEAKKNRDKATILKNIDVAEYKKLATEAISKAIDRIDARTYSTDEIVNNRIRGLEKVNARRSLDIMRPDFNGFNDKGFSYIVSRALKTEAQYTAEYKALANNPDALALYEYIFDLNTKAKAAGYLDRTGSKLFLPFITNTMLQRLAKSNNKLSTLKDSVKDQYTVNVNQKQAYGKRDPETGEQDRSVPVYFTVGEKEGTDYSKDLLKMIPRYIQAFTEFETGKSLEDLFLGIHKVEQNKGHLEVDRKSGNVYFEGGSPAVFPGNTKNAELVKKIIDDSIYGISQDTDTILDRAVGKFAKGTDEEKEEKALSTKKVIEQSNMLTQQLAVGLKLLVAIPNYVGAFIQQGINAGLFYKSGEYKLNHVKVIASAFQGREGNIAKALIHQFIPLNDSIAKEKGREIARKESLLKYVSMWSFNDVMMSSNRIPDVAHELTNAKTWIDNTMVVDGKLTNIRQYVRNVEFANKYKDIEAGTKESGKFTDKDIEARVAELKETKSLPKIAKFNAEGELEIPGFDMEKGNLAEYRIGVVEYGRYITGQMNRDNKAEYRRNIIATSFMMFKNWIPKQVSLRALDIHHNAQLGEWEYGRTRLFFKTWQHLGLTNILKIRNITNATPEGIRIMREMLVQKKSDYYKKTGQELTISEEQFFDMVRKELKNEYKELQMLLVLAAMVVGAKLAVPPDDDDEDAFRKNQYKTFLKAVNKVSDELYFYWSPLSAQSITRGTILPSLGILTKVTNIMEHTGTEIFGIDWKNKDIFSPDIREKNQTLKYWLDLLPIASQFEHELLPIISPEAATSLGIKVSGEARPHQ